MLAAVLAAVGHGLAVFAFNGIDRTTVTANRLTTPTITLKVFTGRFLIGELLKELES